MDKNGRDKFDELFREIMSGKNEEYPIPSEVGKIDCPIPPEGLIYEYLFEVRNFPLILCTQTAFPFTI